MSSSLSFLSYGLIGVTVSVIAIVTILDEPTSSSSPTPSPSTSILPTSILPTSTTTTTGGKKTRKHRKR